MSKSLGNVATIREVVDRWGPEPTLLFFLTAHWRKPIDFSEETMDAAAAQLRSFANAFAEPARATADAEREWARLAAALDDDFNTPDALGILHEWRAARHLDLLGRGLELFGIALSPSVVVYEEDGVVVRASGDVPPSLVSLVTDRHKARSERDFSRADELRGRIESAGWVLHDEPGGYRLERRA
jgi:cysteinyl-tRNA synthetase